MARAVPTAEKLHTPHSHAVLPRVSVHAGLSADGTPPWPDSDRATNGIGLLGIAICYTFPALAFL